MTFRLLALLSLLIGPALPGAAQYFGRNKVQYDTFDFRRFQTPHFEIYFYPEEQEAISDVARMAERWYDRHTTTFERDLRDRKSLIFYANDADFQQTTIISGLIGQGTGGVTESLKERVTMPLTGIYAETDHVLGHELVHSFQYDLALNPEDTTGFALGALPLWLVEGMAEYLSVGREDAHTAMWMRDAALREDLPTIEDLTRGTQYFPYRYGQALMAYVGGVWGDRAVTRLFEQTGRVGLDSAIIGVLGIGPQTLSERWHQAINAAYLPLVEDRTPAREAGQRLLAVDIDAGEINLAPAVSPDGRYVAFLSERDLFNINLFIADTETGEVIQKLRSTGTDPHFDALRFINSSGTWSPDGKSLAFVTFVQGDNEIAILDVESGKIRRRYSTPQTPAVASPAWSPDGRTIAFSGIRGGISDLYLLDLETGTVRQLTEDRYAALQPAWSPDGGLIAYVTDLGPNGTDFERLVFGKPRLALIDVATGETRVLRPFGDAQHHNPEFSPDGRDLFFISDQDGFKDIYRYRLNDGSTYRVTRLQTGVSGISTLSPAMSVATSTGRMLFSVFTDNRYTVYGLDATETGGVPVTSVTPQPAASLLPPAQVSDSSLVATYLSRPQFGLPESVSYELQDYTPRITLSAIAPPTLGASVGGVFGTQLSGGIGFYFSDMLNRHNLTLSVQVQGSYKDIGGLFGYYNQARRLNYGASIGHIPLLFGGARSGFGEDENGIPVRVIERIFQRVYVDQLSVGAAYPLTITRRFEFDVGATRYGYGFEIERTLITPDGRSRRDRFDLDEAEPDPSYFAALSAAFVGDYTNMGFASPVQGGRYRFQVAPQIGTETFVTVLADYRRYFFAQPFTVAVRGLHIGNYGADPDDMFAMEYLGYSYYPSFVRGYSFRGFEAGECSTVNGNCPEIDRLQGTRIALASAELRIPLLGVERFGLINFRYLPTEITLFGDAGLAWNADTSPELAFERRTSERVPVFSAGVAARVNLLGAFILEPYFAYPFQRPDKGWHFGLLLTPGW